MKISAEGRSAMKKGLLFLAALAVSSVLCAQENQNFGREDILAAFKEYNPAALEKAAQNPAYNEILNKVLSAYSAPKTDANLNEMIALVLNFDYSLQLQTAREEYINGRTLQFVSGAELAALEDRVIKEIHDVVQGVYKNTLQVKQWQIERYKDYIKTIKKDKSLSKEQQKAAVAGLNDQIKTTKAEIKTLKKNSKQKIKDTANVYFAEIRSDYDKKILAERQAARAQDLQAAQSSARDIKANNKKPVAQ